MKKYFTCEMKGDAEHKAVDNVGGRDESKRLQAGHEKFAPMYLIRQEDGDPKKLEMCACSHERAIVAVRPRARDGPRLTWPRRT